MDEQTQAQFLQWLGAQFGVTTQEELEEALGSIDDEQMQQLYGQFQQESQAQAFRKGGQLNYLRKLKAFKKGGSASIKEGSAKVTPATKGYKPSKKVDNGTKPQGRKEAAKMALSKLVNKNKLK